jgi:hypothetical protein
MRERRAQGHGGGRGSGGRRGLDHRRTRGRPAWRALGALLASAASAIAIAQVSITPPSPPVPVIGAPYAQALAASGGTPPYSYLQMAGSLPAGLALDPATGSLVGTPTRAGAYDFTIYAVDHEGKEAMVHAFGVIAATLQLAALPPAATVGTAYNQALAVTGGTAPYTFALTGGSLPPGMALSPDGMLTGAPAAAGSFAFTVTVTDSAGSFVPFVLSLTASAAPAGDAAVVPVPALDAPALALLALLVALAAAHAGSRRPGR